MGTLNANTKLLSIQINILNNTFPVFLMLSLKLFVKKIHMHCFILVKLGKLFFTGMEDTAAIPYLLLY